LTITVVGKSCEGTGNEDRRTWQWGHDFKLIVDPNGDSTGFYRDLLRMNDEQRANWMAAYESENQEFLKAKLTGKELAIWKFNRYIKDYLRTIKSVDDGVGEVLDYLKEAGLEENTIVIYTSDQDFILGNTGGSIKDSCTKNLSHTSPDEISERD